MCNLENSGLFRLRDKGFDWQDVKEVSFFNLIRQKYKLIEEDIDIKNPTSYAYVFGGLKPLSVKFIEYFIEKRGFKGIGKKSKYFFLNDSDGTHSWRLGVPR